MPDRLAYGNIYVYKWKPLSWESVPAVGVVTQLLIHRQTLAPPGGVYRRSFQQFIVLLPNVEHIHFEPKASPPETFYAHLSGKKKNLPNLG